MEHRAPPVIINGKICYLLFFLFQDISLFSCLGDFSLSCTPVVCRYLGKRFGLCPASEEDQWHAEQLNHTIHDYIAEGRLAFHGLDHNMTYYKQIEETKPYIKTFLETRLHYYLRHFLRVLQRNGGGKG